MKKIRKIDTAAQEFFGVTNTHIIHRGMSFDMIVCTENLPRIPVTVITYLTDTTFDPVVGCDLDLYIIVRINGGNFPVKVLDVRSITFEKENEYTEGDYNRYIETVNSSLDSKLIPTVSELLACMPRDMYAHLIIEANEKNNICHEN